MRHTPGKETALTLKDAPISLTDHNDARTVVEDIQAEILLRICLLDYPPGQQLKEAAIADEFGVSRTPVRDAISRINHLGLVETRNGVGTVVVSLSADEICQVYDMRLHLAALVGNIEPDEVTDLQKSQAKDLLQQALALVDDFDLRTYVMLNHQLNNLIADLINNIVLRSFWRQTYYQAASTWHQIGTIASDKVSRSLVDELSEISTALDANDIRAVGYIQRVHIGYGYQRIKTYLLQPRDVQA